ncbi:MAG: MBL fold metallo-hydrolase, partial [Haliea sp.]|nr:MBL fold metallo-hydrolase [Haliea sp.]
MKRALIIVGTLAVIISITYNQRESIVTRIMERGLESRMGAGHIATLKDGLHLALCGAGGPLPAANASGPCVAVVAGEQF